MFFFCFFHTVLSLNSTVSSHKLSVIPLRFSLLWDIISYDFTFTLGIDVPENATDEICIKFTYSSLHSSLHLLDTSLTRLRWQPCKVQMWWWPNVRATFSWAAPAAVTPSGNSEDPPGPGPKPSFLLPGSLYLFSHPCLLWGCLAKPQYWFNLMECNILEPLTRGTIRRCWYNCVISQLHNV